MFLPIMFLGILADKVTIKTTLTETWKQILDDLCKLSRYVKSWGDVSHEKLQEPGNFEESYGELLLVSCGFFIHKT